MHFQDFICFLLWSFAHSVYWNGVWMYIKPSCWLAYFSDFLILPVCKQESYMVMHCIYVCQYIYIWIMKISIFTGENESFHQEFVTAYLCVWSVHAHFDPIYKFCEVKQNRPTCPFRNCFWLRAKVSWPFCSLEWKCMTASCCYHIL